MRELSSILPYVRPYRSGILIGVVCVVLANAFQIAGPWFLKLGIDALEQPGVTRGTIAFYALNIGASPLPIDLSVIGAPGCFFYPAAAPTPLLITGIEDLANNPGVISLPLSLPAGAAGNDVFVQAAVWNDLLPPNNANLTLSNGICLKVGSL